MRERKGHFIDGLPRPTSGLSRTALTESRRARPPQRPKSVRSPQRSAEKTRGRAGSPTRATRHSLVQSQIPVGYPALS
jgi:hypothetical protein